MFPIDDPQPVQYCSADGCSADATVQLAISETYRPVLCAEHASARPAYCGENDHGDRDEHGCGRRLDGGELVGWHCPEHGALGPAHNGRNGRCGCDL